VSYLCLGTATCVKCCQCVVRVSLRFALLGLVASSVVTDSMEIRGRSRGAGGPAPLFLAKSILFFYLVYNV